jgi:hypothetical protein
MATSLLNDSKTYPTCKTCDRGTLIPTKIRRLSGPAVAIGYILLIPSILGIAVCAILLIAFAIAGPALAGSDPFLAIIISGGGVLAEILAGVGCFIGGLIGWLLVMKKHVLQCDSCGAVVDSAAPINSQSSWNIWRTVLLGFGMMLIVIAGAGVLAHDARKNSAQQTPNQSSPETAEPISDTSSVESAQPPPNDSSTETATRTPDDSGAEETQPDATQPQQENPGFQTYTNSRYGFRVDYPEAFIPQQPPENGDGLGFKSHDGKATLDVAGGNNDAGFTLKEEFDSAIKDVQGQLGYHEIGGSWFVVTWTDGSNVGYIKEFVGSGSYDSLTITYPVEQRPQYDSVVTTIEKSFEPGNVGNSH